MRKNKKQRRIMFLLILLLAVTVGFALLSTTLFINGTAGIQKNTWDIHWNEDSIVETNGSVTATTPANVSDMEKKNVSFVVELELPGDFYEFTVDAKNYGSVDGAISEVKANYFEEGATTPTTIPSYLNFSVSYAEGGVPATGDVLKSGESKKYKVRIEFKSNVTSLPSDPPTGRIEIEVPYQQHKEKGIKYNVGDLVYFDPISEDKCDSTTFSLSDIMDGNSTCYKWRVITTDDTESKTDIKLQLDHNLTRNNVTWSSGSRMTITGDTSGVGVYVPTGLLGYIMGSTSSWTRVPLLNYSYDTTGASTSGMMNTDYGVLNCTNGSCVFNRNGGTFSFMSGARARVITVEELAEITNTVASSNAYSQGWDISKKGFYFSKNSISVGDEYEKTPNDTTSPSTALSWLVENTSNDTESGATANVYSDGTGANYNKGELGYWTLTPEANVGDSSMMINALGFTYGAGTGSSVGIGARPLIYVEKSKITKE